MSIEATSSLTNVSKSPTLVSIEVTLPSNESIELFTSAPNAFTAAEISVETAAALRMSVDAVNAL